MDVMIADHFKDIQIISVEGDASVTIAELASFVKFDPATASFMRTKSWGVAFNALCHEYESKEMVSGGEDFHSGFFMTFTDGSTLRYEAT